MESCMGKEDALVAPNTGTRLLALLKEISEQADQLALLAADKLEMISLRTPKEEPKDDAVDLPYWPPYFNEGREHALRTQRALDRIAAYFSEMEV